METISSKQSAEFLADSMWGKVMLDPYVMAQKYKVLMA